MSMSIFQHVIICMKRFFGNPLHQPFVMNTHTVCI